MKLEDILNEKKLQIIKAVIKEIVTLTPEFFNVKNLGLKISVKNKGILSIWCDKYRDVYTNLRDRIWHAAKIKFDWGDDFYESVEDMLYQKCEQLGLFSSDIMQSNTIVADEDDTAIFDKLVKDGTLYIPDSCIQFELLGADKKYDIRTIVSGKALEELTIRYTPDSDMGVSLDLTSSPDFKSLWDRYDVIKSVIPCKDQKYCYSIRYLYNVVFSQQPRIIDIDYIRHIDNVFLTIDKNFDVDPRYTPREVLNYLGLSKVRSIYVEGSRDFLIDILKRCCPGSTDATIKKYVTKIEDKYSVKYNQTRYK